MNLKRDEEFKKIYTIGQISRLLDVKEHTIRFWEKEFPMILPLRTSSGRREYSNKDFILLQKIKKLLYEEGYTTKGALKELQLEIQERDTIPSIQVEKDNSHLFYESPLDPFISEEKELLKEIKEHVEANNQKASNGLALLKSQANPIENKVNKILWEKIYKNLSTIIDVLEQ